MNGAPYQRHNTDATDITGGQDYILDDDELDNPPKRLRTNGEDEFDGDNFSVGSQDMFD